MTHAPQQIEFVGQLVNIAGGIAAAILALAQLVKTLLEVGDKLRRRRRRARRPGRAPRRGSLGSHVKRH